MIKESEKLSLGRDAINLSHEGLNLCLDNELLTSSSIRFVCLIFIIAVSALLLGVGVGPVGVALCLLASSLARYCPAGIRPLGTLTLTRV